MGSWRRSESPSSLARVSAGGLIRSRRNPRDERLAALGEPVFTRARQRERAHPEPPAPTQRATHCWLKENGTTVVLGPSDAGNFQFRMLPLTQPESPGK